jgi:FPC/CPF motif-containing protein YcgG
MKRVIRRQELALQGSINPMLAEFGELPESRQYSGRVVGQDWHCPFSPRT